VDSLNHPAYFAAMTHDQVLDTRGLICPLPVLKARKRLQTMAAGDVLRLLADDPVAVIDVPNFCNEAGHGLLAAQKEQDAHVFMIRKGG